MDIFDNLRSHRIAYPQITMRIDNFKNICILGWGLSGISLSNLALSLGKKVLVSEARERNDFPSASIDYYKNRTVEFEFGGHSKEFLKKADLIISSPGVDTLHNRLRDIINELGITCVGEIEFAYWFNKAKIIAVTGTNGKTTTSFLIHQLLKEHRKKVFLGGNIGTPFSSFVLDTKKTDIVVLEVSSFQLETIFEFRPFVGVLLNIESDHLDRYPNLNDYLQAKINLFRNQKSDDWALLNKNMDFRFQVEHSLRSKVVYFSDEFNNENFSCVYRVGGIFGLAKADCLKVFSSFQGLDHRMELVRKINQVSFINDSKATNPSSTIWALKNAKTPIILLAGGKDKGLDYSSIKPYLRRIKKIKLFGQAASKIKEVLNSKIESDTFTSMEEAVIDAYREAQSGDTILLSPMCSSFDAFSDYKERGDRFKAIVNNLPGSD